MSVSTAGTTEARARGDGYSGIPLLVVVTAADITADPFK
jgi:hypothetical protein